ncbi:MAG TPA: D-2-hydroxyacid dehydrogenase, partial [Actinomycetota bacterium]
PADSPLWAMPQVIVSPHVSGDVEGWERAVVQVFTDNAARWVRGEPLVNLIDKRAGHGTS